MANGTALRFAKTSLSLFGHERTFSIGIGEAEELDPIAQAFESLGCKVVQTDPIRLILTLCCEAGEERKGHTLRSLPDGYPPRNPACRFPGLGEALVRAAQTRAIAREVVERAREARVASKAMAGRCAQSLEAKETRSRVEWSSRGGCGSTTALARLIFLQASGEDVPPFCTTPSVGRRFIGRTPPDEVGARASLPRPVGASRSAPHPKEVGTMSGADYRSRTEQIKAETRRTVAESARVCAQARFVIATTEDLVEDFYRRNPKSIEDGGPEVNPS